MRLPESQPRDIRAYTYACYGRRTSYPSTSTSHRHRRQYRARTPCGHRRAGGSSSAPDNRSASALTPSRASASLTAAPSSASAARPPPASRTASTARSSHKPRGTDPRTASIRAASPSSTENHTVTRARPRHHPRHKWGTKRTGIGSSRNIGGGQSIFPRALLPSQRSPCAGSIDAAHDWRSGRYRSRADLRLRGVTCVVSHERSFMRADSPRGRYSRQASELELSSRHDLPISKVCA